MNERMVKRGIIPAALAFLCALMPVLPWFKVDLYYAALKASPWQISKVVNEFASYGSGGVKAISVIVIVLLVLITLLVLCDILSALCEFIDLDLNERFPIINVIAVAGYGLEILLALAAMIIVGIVKSQSYGISILKSTAWPVFVILFAGCGIAIKIINKSFASSGAKPAKMHHVHVGDRGREGNETEAVGSEETMVIGRKAKQGYVPAERKSAAPNAAKIGSVEMDVRVSDFKRRYPNYKPFGQGKFAVDPRKPRTRMGSYLFAAGAYPFAVRREYAHVGMHIEADSTPRNVIGSIRSGSVVLAGGMAGEWVLCKYQGRYGWIRKKYLVQVRK